ncbi:MAG: hypothetical protein JNL98_02630 [Bryobacterales bacterium]|jgi:hypothetical protein|nr:hypothetical protein [Bryobacterales bacterium]
MTNETNKQPGGSDVNTGHGQYGGDSYTYVPRADSTREIRTNSPLIDVMRKRFEEEGGSR